MQNIGKSEFFNPGSGVTHRDMADDHSSPSVRGGAFRHMNEVRISRKEFELRKSMSYLKEFGPDSDRMKVNQSLDVHAFMDPARESLIHFNDSGSNFTNIRKKQNKNDRIRLPALNKSRDFATKDLALTKDEIKLHNESIKDFGPSPGVWDVASARKKLRPMVK